MVENNAAKESGHWQQRPRLFIIELLLSAAPQTLEISVKSEGTAAG